MKKNNFSNKDGIVLKRDGLDHFRLRINSFIKEDFKGNRAAWAQEMGLVSETVGKWLKKGSIPKADNVIKIAKKYQKSTDWLLTGNQFENKNIDFKERAELTELKEEQMHILKKYTEALEENNIIRKEILKLKQTKREDDPEDFKIPKRSICSLIV